MKSLLYILVFFLFPTQSLISQISVDLLPQNRYDTVISTDRSVMFYAIDIKNIGASSLSLKFETLQKDFSGTLCLGSTCYPNIPNSGNVGNLGSGNSTYLYLDLFTNNQVDSGEVIIRIYESGNESNVDTLFVRLVVIENSSPTFIGEHSLETEPMGIIYPNPVVSGSKIPLSIDDQRNLIFVVTDVSGKHLYHEIISPGQKEIVLSEVFPVGIYFYGLKNDQGFLNIKKMIVQ